MRPKGFTLIEMVVAFAILGLTLTTLYGAFENSLERVRHDAHLSEGTLVAQSLLARAGTELPLAPGKQNGEWNGYAYELIETVVPATVGELPETLPTIRVVASVSWPESTGRRSIFLSTLKLIPAVAP